MSNYLKRVLLREDNAERRCSKKRKISSGITREYLLACSPELESAEK
ncbi:MAG: hypothetical protein ACTMUB_04625 [cyanobacterium endosymbiont of Rhopalodia musculus]|nr:hypothetical protein [cyanobacterium endosymbiont of Epithemia clementina EcSB]WGT67452.1 hypothetical protein P3F56_09725 [cyanobacterium endosymbiont of Epithemia clementina EcSB]